ncbi:hypothetical protein ROBYS_06470 [Roseobacter sp. OBYS 0001]|nr:hypothetical protein ROBYS_06470 [Roseobacter sp. OBYS 0001]
MFDWHPSVAQACVDPDHRPPHLSAPPIGKVRRPDALTRRIDETCKTDRGIGRE